MYAGKISPQDIVLVMPRVSMLLSPGGYAALYLLYDRVNTLHTYIHVCIHILHDVETAYIQRTTGPYAVPNAIPDCNQWSERFLPSSVDPTPERVRQHQLHIIFVYDQEQFGHCHSAL